MRGERSFKPSGIVTLTTDFGHRDPFVGVMKGRILERFPDARIVDLTHEIERFTPAEAGFWLERSFAYFPTGTVHVAVVDPGVGTSRGIVCVSARGHVFLAPDNGLLARLVRRHEVEGMVRLKDAALKNLGIDRPSATFHGRDIFAPVAAEIASGRRTVDQLGEPVEALLPSSIPEPAVRAGSVTCAIVTIDHFGNLISNIEVELIAPLRHPQVRIGGRSLGLSRTYGDAAAGEYLALVNSFGVVEVARSEGSASAGLGLARGAPIEVLDSPPGDS